MMKVTVCFGTIRVVVPCGTGELLVRDLIHEAIRRYKKAAGKDQGSWVIVHHLQTQSGILDPDDKVSDVADDREQILATFDDSGPDPGVPQGGGDGASGSSVGTGSPDIFREPSVPKYVCDNNTPHIEVTNSNAINSGLQILQVRRSSDPSLHQIGGLDPRNPILNIVKNQDATKRWSAAPVCRSEIDNHPADGGDQDVGDHHNGHGYLPPSWESELEESQPESMQSQFQRPGRLSMQFLGNDQNGYKWMDAAERAVHSYNSKSLPRDAKRKEPLGQAYESIREKSNEWRGDSNEMMVGPAPAPSGGSVKVATISPNRKQPGAQAVTSLQVANTRKLGKRIEISLRKGPHGLGFSVTTRDNPAGGHCPIYIKTILARGAAIEDGRLKPGDRLLEVDGVPMTGKSQSDVVGILRATQPGATVRIVVSRQQEIAEKEEREIGVFDTEPDVSAPPKPPPPVLPQKPHKSPKLKKPTDITVLEQQHFIEAGSESASSNDSVPVFPWRNREILTLHIPVHDSEKAGLGVSVKGKTGSNNSSGESGSGSPAKHDGDLGIFVKSVLNGGAASRDGRLKMNDQLLNVNGVSLLGQSNAEAMETLRKAMLQNAGKYPGMITLTVSRKISRPGGGGHSANNSLVNHESPSSDARHSRSLSSTSEQSGKTVIYLSSDKNDSQNGPIRSNLNSANTNRYSNPVLDRLTGGTGHIQPSPLQQNQRPYGATNALRNESYYMATNDTWSPSLMINGNSSVLIEEDPEPMSPTLPMPNSVLNQTPKGGDVTYDSQLSLETNPPIDAFSRDAIGRRSMSEKHHAALDAKETGTYQRNKKLREQREKERRLQNTKSAVHLLGSMESLTSITNEAMDRVGELGPSLGLKKSSSLESLQTMVQIQMSDEPLGPMALRSPRGRGREESLRAAVERPPENKPRKHWLLEDGPSDTEGGFINRNGPFQSSLNDRKAKSRPNKKPGLLKGLGHMFRFGKHRKDGVAPPTTTTTTTAASAPGTEAAASELGRQQQQQSSTTEVNIQKLGFNQQQSQQQQHHHQSAHDRPPGGPPIYQPPPPPQMVAAAAAAATANGSAIHQNDLFNHRYSHYVNYDELQQQISRRHHHYHSQRSTRTTIDHHHHQQHQNNGGNNNNIIINNNNNVPRPISGYYEYETVQHVSSRKGQQQQQQQQQPQQQQQQQFSTPPSANKWQINGNLGASGRSNHSKNSSNNNNNNNNNNINGGNVGVVNRGPFVTQVQIRDQKNGLIGLGGLPQPASKV